MPERKEAHGRRHRHDAQFQVLLNLGTVRIDRVAIHAGDRTLVEPRADARLQIVAETHEPFAADRRAVEVLDVERQRLEIGKKHIAVHAGVFPFEEESADGHTHCLAVF
jgi:hypothetical protein